MTTPRLTNVSNPAAFGVEFISPDSGTRMSLVNSRGTGTLMLGMKPLGRTQWVNVPVSNPERFGLTAPPKQFRDFLAIARTFIAAGAGEES